MTKSFEIACTGYSIMADWYEGENTDQILLILHGFTSSRSRQADVTNYMVNATGASALVIEYTGHGESPFDLKDTRPAQHAIEAICAYEWIEKNYPDAKITVIGNSYGSFLAAHLSHYKSFEKMVLRAPAIYRPEALYDLWSVRFNDEEAYGRAIRAYRNDLPLMLAGPLLDTRTLKFHGPTLVVVHENDETIPRSAAQAYIQAFQADSFIAGGFSHAVSQSNISAEQLDAYYKQIADWLLAN